MDKIIDCLDKINWKTIIIVSGGCNLNCKYCLVNKSKSGTNYPNFLKDTNAAIANGSYLDTFKKAFQKYNQSPCQVEIMELWGNEPTLMLKDLNKVWKDWLDFFPNLKGMTFSTNGIDCTDDIFNFILEIDKYIDHEIEISIQYSYDGFQGEINERQHNKEKKDTEQDSIVINNLINLITKLNSVKLHNVKIDFILHAVLSMFIVDNFNTTEDINKFVEQYMDTLYRVDQSIINQRIIFRGGVFLHENAHDWTSDDGINYCSFMKKFQNILSTKKHNFKNEGVQYRHIFKEVFGTLEDDIISLCYETNCRSIDKLIDNFITNKDLPINSQCSSLDGVLRMDYQGNLLDCHASLYDPYLEKDKLTNTILDQGRWMCKQHGRYLNILKNDKEEIEKLLDFYLTARDPTITLFETQQMINKIYLLALCGQANESYLYDFNKLKRHAFILAKSYQCYNILKCRNGSIFIRGNEEIRFFCNGILDIVEEDINKEIGDF